MSEALEEETRPREERSVGIGYYSFYSFIPIMRAYRLKRIRHMYKLGASGTINFFLASKLQGEQ